MKNTNWFYFPRCTNQYHIRTKQRQPLPCLFYCCCCDKLLQTKQVPHALCLSTKYIYWGSTSAKNPPCLCWVSVAQHWSKVFAWYLLPIQRQYCNLCNYILYVNTPRGVKMYSDYRPTNRVHDSQ